MKEFIESKPYQRIMGEVLTPQETLELNGHTCPKCNSELYDDKAIQYMSNPPQYKTICTKCGYKGMRHI
jgi:predicted RNA-binding Zn-ribbon protein involved in translation (DUF1610 family)